MVSGQTRGKTEEERDFRFGRAKMARDPFFRLGLCLPFLVLCSQNCTETLATQARIPYLKTELTNSEQQRRVQRCREARLFKNLQERGMMVIMEVFAM